ncbi:alkene reductase [Actinopolyspora sp. H202]|uniref:alkene reductase n=1 Tax=Actinopolyspora sp. H202 TaxID=1500456 RepID=UPI003EE651B2
MTDTAVSAVASPLFDSVRLGRFGLSNRLVMAPMTRNRATAHGVPTRLMATYYAQRASAGMIIAEASTPNAVGQTYPDITAIHTSDHVAGWRDVLRAVREAGGGPAFLQLQHGGRVGHPDNSGLTPLAPSPIPLPDTIHTENGRRPSVVPREMTGEDIRATVADFTSAARNAREAGFAGVEVHSANGYLLHQFLAGNTNRRTDEYGGSVRNRVRFVVEVVRAVAAEIGPERTGLRVSPGNTVNGIDEGETTEIYQELVTALSGEDLAYLHVGFADPETEVYREVRANWPGTLIANPVLSAEEISNDGGRRAGERLLDAGADLIALGRPFLANPDLVARMRTGSPLNEIRDKYLMYVGGPTGYTDYPTLAEVNR